MQGFPSFFNVCKLLDVNKPAHIAYHPYGYHCSTSACCLAIGKGYKGSSARENIDSWRGSTVHHEPQYQQSKHLCCYFSVDESNSTCFVLQNSAIIIISICQKNKFQYEFMLFSSFYFLINNFLSVSKMLPCDLRRNLEFL